MPRSSYTQYPFGKSTFRCYSVHLLQRSLTYLTTLTDTQFLPLVSLRAIPCWSNWPTHHQSVLIKFLYFSDDANKKVELAQKWTSLLEEGKNEGEVEKELGQPKLDDVTAKRAKKIIKKLNKEAEAAVSSWDITSYLVGIFIFSYHIYVILKAIHGIYLFQD